MKNIEFLPEKKKKISFNNFLISEQYKSCFLVHSSH